MFGASLARTGFAALHLHSYYAFFEFVKGEASILTEAPSLSGQAVRRTYYLLKSEASPTVVKSRPPGGIYGFVSRPHQN